MIADRSSGCAEEYIRICSFIEKEENVTESLGLCRTWFHRRVQELNFPNAFGTVLITKSVD